MERKKYNYLFADDMIKYEENPKNPTKKLLKWINKFSKVAGYKIDMQKLVAFLFTNKELSEKEIKKIIPFAIVPKEYNS